MIDLVFTDIVIFIRSPPLYTLMNNLAEDIFYIIYSESTSVNYSVTYVLKMLMQIFFFCRHPPADMALRLVYIQNLSRLRRKRRIDLCQTFCHILMYGCDNLEWFLL